MVKHGIQIYARLKPTKRKTGVFESSEDADGNNKLSFLVPKKESEGYVNNKKETYNFKFDRIFPQDASQNEVFEHVAKAVIDNVIAGYNGTIFAYGQTGSGKTFTITGGAERYDDRGLIPRSLSYIFKYQKENPDKVYTTQVTYMEIYNEQGHDLLDQQHQGAKLEDFPKVHLMEGGDGDINLKNLSVHEATNEESALNLLFLGDTNRMIAETPMNMASTRSHCIFSIHMTSREPGSAVIRRSKLHLVDLAGSERIGKTGVGGTLLAEAKYINLSLHYLEQVITALTEKGRSHIPYRNSMLTSVLRDSLGGNCMTTMVATCSVEKGNVDESISTCRFAQRVALIKNDALLNEELSPKLMITRLQQQVKDLRDELQLATGEARTDELTDEEKAKCVELVKTYVEQDGALSVGADMRKIHVCFRLLKDLVVESRQELADKARQAAATSRQEQRSSVSAAPEDFSRVHMPMEVDRLQELLEQRDNEINILVNMLKREKRRVAEATVKSGTVRVSAEEAAAAAAAVTSSVTSPGSIPAMPDTDTMTSTSSSASGDRHGAPSVSPRQSHSTARHNAIQELSVGQREAYELFRRDYRLTPPMEESKAVLKERYAMAKQLGEDVHQSRLDLNAVKKDLEKYRVTAAVRGVADGDTGIPDAIDPEEQAMRDRLQRAKSCFKTCLTQLKDMKAEIDHRKHLLETSRIQMLKDFQAWWMKQERHHQQQQQQRDRHADGTTPLGRQSPVGSRSSRRSGAQTPGSRQRSSDTTLQYTSTETPGWQSHDSTRQHDNGPSTLMPQPPSPASSQSEHQPGRVHSQASLASSYHRPTSSRHHAEHGGSSISLAANFSQPVDNARSQSQRASDSSGGGSTSHRSTTSTATSSRRTTSSVRSSADTRSGDGSRPSGRRHADTSGNTDGHSGHASSTTSLSGRASQIRSHHQHTQPPPQYHQPQQQKQQQQQQHSYDTAMPTSTSDSATGTARSSHLGSSHLGSSHLGTSHLGTSHLGSSHLGSSHLGSSSETPRQITLTGDSRADADILAFMKARQSLLEKGNRR